MSYTFRHIRNALAVASILSLSVPLHAQVEQQRSEAEEIQALSIMLMVTSLRCRTGANDFQREYREFSAAHRTWLEKASLDTRRDMAARYDQRSAKRAHDRLSVSMANAYGNGHPWLGCAELKQITKDLTQERDQKRLSLAARELLNQRPPQVALVDTTSTQVSE